MVKIEIDDEIWDLYRRSWALFGVKTESELVRMLNVGLEDESIAVLKDAEEHLISDEPEALVRRELGMMRGAHK